MGPQVDGTGTTSFLYHCVNRNSKVSDGAQLKYKTTFRRQFLATIAVRKVSMSSEGLLIR